VGDSDLTIHINAAPGQLADRFLMTEALSGWDKDDILKGDDWIPLEQDVELHAPWGSNALTNEGIARIKGLDAVVAGHTKCVTDPQLPGDEGEGGPPASGPPITVCGFGEGNILIGGSGSDLIQGRGADDIIDGDKWLNVRLSVRTNPADPATETRSANSMTELSADVFAGRINPGNIVIVREILSSPGPNDVDTAVYSGALADYDITYDAGSVTVAHVRNLPACCADQGGPKGDGTDTLRNIEKLKFADQTIELRSPNAPTIGTATAAVAQATVTWTAPAGNGGPAISGYAVRVVNDADAQVGDLRPAPANATSLVVTGLANGERYRFQVAAVNGVGTGDFSALSNAVTPQADVVAPTVTARFPGVNWTRVGVGANVTVTFSEPVQTADSTTVQLRETVTNAVVPAAVTYDAASRTVTLNPTANLKTDTRYTVSLSNGIKDLATPAANALTPVSWNFLSGPEPAISGRSPGVNAITVGRGANVTVTFNEAVTGFSGTSVQLQRVSNGVLVPAVVTYNTTTRTITLNPNVNLVALTQYRVILSDAIRDAAGNPIQPTSWTFTTGLL
jgi:hypothetical protein